MAPNMLRLLHWGPMLAFTVIGTITTCTILCDLQWWPVHTLGGAANMTIFLLWNVLTLYNLITAAFTGPGHVPDQWQPPKSEDTNYLQYCRQCEAYKAPRSHHCRKCQRCVMKMDHHCPWINNCVGHKNHASFTKFLFFAPCGCIHGLCILVPAMYRAINRDENAWLVVYIDPDSGMSSTVFSMGLFGVSLAFGITVAVGILFYIQMKSILKNETGIETWIIDKAYYRELEENEPEFVYPYNLGRWENFKLVFHWRLRPELTGLWWPVIEGCNQYTLTVEQLKQKQEKVERSVEYLIQESYSGSFFPVTMGPRVCCCPPCTDEPRIAVSPGDRVVATRWKKRWLYGDKVLKDMELKKKRRVRGWFPRRCAVEVMNGNSEKVVEEQNVTVASDTKHLERKKDD